MGEHKILKALIEGEYETARRQQRRRCRKGEHPCPCQHCHAFCALKPHTTDKICCEPSDMEAPAAGLQSASTTVSQCMSAIEAS